MRTTTITYVYCSHCIQFSKAAIEAKFFSCSTCGKLVSEVSVKGNSWLVTKKKKKKKKFKSSRKAFKFIKPYFPHKLQRF
ncbi:hypothetical protein V6N13_063310 [Hibiscus sabdariffa]|uniref:Uncharacterized protein n=1 Tax=Hibiscus sabdariffa TaxID=183260 RepID=A0ABR2C4T5_9ROSI